MTAKYEVIENQTLSTSVSSVTMTSIPGSYKDLFLIVGGTPGVSGASFRLTFNGDGGDNYGYCWMRKTGTGSGGETSGYTSATARIQNYGVNGTGFVTADIFDYSATDKHKSVLMSLANVAQTTSRVAGRWANTNAITSLTVTGNWPAGSTFKLLGVN